MVRVGGFLKSQNRIRRQRARGRFISPYQVGGTIFGKSTRMQNNPFRFPSASTRINPEPWRVKQALRRMKGGTIFGPGDLRKVLWANQAKARKQKGGNVFSKLKKRIQIDFPHRPFPAAHPMHDWYRVRKGIKRGRR